MNNVNKNDVTKIMLDGACFNLRCAMARATLCGYVDTVREEHNKKVITNWKKYAKKHTIHRNTYYV